MRFEFTTPTRIVFGPGVLGQSGDLVRPQGRKPLVVTGRHTERAAPLLRSLEDRGLNHEVFAVPGEPTLAEVKAGADLTRQKQRDCVIGFGGGSALDAAKAIAAVATNPGDLLDYLEVIGRGQPLRHTPLPFIAIPTTAGTGSEVTRNAVLGSMEHKVKVSLRSPQMLAKVAIVDPELTLGLPPEITATTGMDALTQCIEAYVCCKANPMTDVFCVDGIRRAARSLLIAYRDGGNLTARTDMALASLYSGIALANAGLGAVHGLAGPIGGMFPAPHGAVCASLLPHVMQINLTALRNRQPGNPVLDRFAEIARWLTGDARSSADAGVDWLKQLQRDLQIPQLGQWGIAEQDFPAIIERASLASSMKGNPVQLTEAEMRGAMGGSQ